MYLDFYGFKKAPFHITPDPEFLFLSPSHKTALGSLIYGIEERQGFVTLIGEVGLGKTTLLRSYLERVDRRQLKTIYIFHSNVSFRDLLRALFHEFGEELATDDLFDAVNHLHQILVDEYRQARNVTLIVDEAHQMPVDTLEHLRMLSNLETSTQKLLQIVLAGQPELNDKLNLHELRQLKQRVVVRATIAPLSEAESLAYIQHRLSKALLTDRPIFTKRALRRIIHEAKGTPRVLNILCTNALISGFGYQSARITDTIVREVIGEYTGKKLTRWRKSPVFAGIGLVLLVGIVGFLAYRQTVLLQAKRFYYHSPSLQRLYHTFFGNQEAASPQAARNLPQTTASAPRPGTTVTLPATPPNASGSSTATTSSPTAVPPLPVPASSADTSLRSLPPPGADPKAGLTATPPVAGNAQSPLGASPATSGSPTTFSSAAPGVTKTVKRGDSLARMATDVYGRFDLTVLDWIKQHNPHLQNVNRIEVGVAITFPPLPPAP